MNDDFKIINKCFDGEEPVHVYPVADVHLGALECNEKEWAAFCQQIIADPRAYVILDGDLINNNTRSSVGNPWDDTMRPREQKRAMVEYLRPIKDRILCCVSGNHERRSMKDADDDPTYDIMAKLDLEDIYRTNAAFLNIRTGPKKCGAKKTQYYASYDFAITHGAGGGIYTGATVNRNERWGNTIDGVDCVIVGHTHKGTITRPSKLVFDNIRGRVWPREYLVISCTSWQQYGSYALQKMLLPATTCRPMVMELAAAKKEKSIKTIW